MIVEYIRYRIAEDAAGFEDAYRRASEALRATPACHAWELRRCVEEPERYVLRIEWRSLDAHLQGFRHSAEFAAFFQHVRPYVDRIEEMLHYESTDVSSASLCQALGGVGACFRLARELHTLAKRDPLLAPRFASVAPTHVPHLGMWLCEVFGGPKLYSETLDDIGPMLARHAGLYITEPERTRFVDLAADAARLACPDAGEVALAAVSRYFDWGSRVAVENSKPDHVGDPSAGVPSWGF